VRSFLTICELYSQALFFIHTELSHLKCDRSAYVGSNKKVPEKILAGSAHRAKRREWTCTHGTVFSARSGGIQQSVQNAERHGCSMKRESARDQPESVDWQAGHRKARAGKGGRAGQPLEWSMTALVKLWEISTIPVDSASAPGQRTTGRRRQANDVQCARRCRQLIQIHQDHRRLLLRVKKRVRGLRQNRNPSTHPLLYQKIQSRLHLSDNRADRQLTGGLRACIQARSQRGEFCTRSQRWILHKLVGS